MNWQTASISGNNKFKLHRLSTSLGSFLWRIVLVLVVSGSTPCRATLIFSPFKFPCIVVLVAHRVPAGMNGTTSFALLVVVVCCPQFSVQLVTEIPEPRSVIEWWCFRHRALLRTNEEGKRSSRQWRQERRSCGQEITSKLNFPNFRVALEDWWKSDSFKRKHRADWS